MNEIIDVIGVLHRNLLNSNKNLPVTTNRSFKEVFVIECLGDSVETTILNISILGLYV